MPHFHGNWDKMKLYYCLGQDTQMQGSRAELQPESTNYGSAYAEAAPKRFGAKLTEM